MNEYLSSISGTEASYTSASLSSSNDNGGILLEVPDQLPAMTSSLLVDKEAQRIQDNVQYLSPQKIKLKKYTLKKG